MNEYQEGLKQKMNTLAHGVYRETKNFPKAEKYGMTSQINRASLSVVLNYIEGYARARNNSRHYFLDVSYGSLQETKYLLHFTYVEKLLSEEEYKKMFTLADGIGAMLWKEIQNIKEHG